MGTKQSGIHRSQLSFASFLIVADSLTERGTLNSCRIFNTNSHRHLDDPTIKTKKVWLLSIHLLSSKFAPLIARCVLSAPSSVMSTPVPPPPQPRGIDYSLPTCGETRCNSHGKCVTPPGGGTDLVCDCVLGYQGQHCEDTVNGALSLPLTLSVLAVIFGLLIMAFIFAKLRQKQKKRLRRHLAEGHGFNIAV